MNLLLRLSRAVQGPLLTCGLVTRTLCFSPTASKARCAPLYLCSTIKQSNDDIMPKQSGWSKDSESPQEKMKKTIVLSAEAQRAIWAWQIIKMISEAEPPKKFRDSLVNRLLNVQINTDNYEFDLEDKYKDQILQMFTVGIEIDKRIYRQERIQLAQTEDLKSLKRKLVFYPTTIVSKLVFNTIKQQAPMLMFGSYGIGKTISFVLFMELAKHVNKLVFLAQGEWVPIEKREKYAAQLKLLIDAELVVVTPKCWYWSINRNLQDTKKSMMELIKAQTQEFCLEGKHKEKLQTIDDLEDLIYFINRLTPFPKSSIKSITIYDQINALISYLRKWNYIVDDMNKLKRSYPKNRQIAKKRLFLIPSQKAQNLAAIFKMLAAPYILNSSFQVERQFIVPPKQSSSAKQKPRKHLEIVDHENTLTAQISYGTKLKDEETKIEYSQLFLMLLKQKCRQLGVPKQNIQSIVQKFTQKTIEVKFYYRFLFIREYLYPVESFPGEQLNEIKSLNSQMLLKTLNVGQTKQQIDTFLIKLKDHYKDFCLERCKIQLNRYVGKPSDQQQKAIRRLVIHCIRKIAKKMLIKSQKQTRSVLSFSIEDLKNDLKTYIRNDFDVKQSFFELKGRKNATLLPFNYKDGVIELEWPVQDFLEISRDYNLFELTQQSLDFLGIDSTLGDFWMDRRSALGHLFEHSLAKLMQYSEKVQFNNYYVRGSGTKKKIQKKSLLSFEMPDSEVYFWALNKSFKMNKTKKGVSLYHNLQAILKNAKEKPGFYFKGIPYINDPETKEAHFSQTSKSIDFIFVKYHKDKDFYEINTFDVTISEKSVTAKVNDARKLLEKLLDFEQKPGETKFKVIHHIVSPIQSCQNDIKVSQNLEIKYISIESITFSDCPKKIKDIFETARHLVIYSRKNDLS